ncbi:MAG: hypothetical protein ACLTSG_03560 [Lachnospiraceae bacterium]
MKPRGLRGAAGSELLAERGIGLIGAGGLSAHTRLSSIVELAAADMLNIHPSLIPAFCGRGLLRACACTRRRSGAA